MHDQSGLHKKFQASQVYIVKPCQKKKKVKLQQPTRSKWIEFYGMEGDSVSPPLPQFLHDGTTQRHHQESPELRIPPGFRTEVLHMLAD